MASRFRLTQPATDRAAAPSRAAGTPEHAGPGPQPAALALQASQRQAAQRASIEAGFGRTAQRAGTEEEAALQGRLVQRQGLEDEEPLQGRLVQREEMMDEEEPLQAAGPGTASPGMGAPAPAAAAGGLPGPLRAGIEALSGQDMSDVQVHRNSPQPAAVSALAYAQGNDIHLAPGQDHHLPHEAWHVVQQRQGRVAPTLDLGGVAVNDDPGLEGEADAMGARAAQGPTTE